MRHELLKLVRCPSCVGGQLVVVEAQERLLRYGDETICEVERGTVACEACQARYPVRDYVLSFEDLLAPDVREDARFWGAFLRGHFEQGILGFMDTRTDPVPFLTNGVPEPYPLDGQEWGGIHVELARHPAMKPGGLVVDMGAGAGWSSLFLAREGFEVISYDPAFDSVMVAKRHAIDVGVYLEYICCDAASFHLPPNSAAAVFALHSLHHVPDIEGALRQIHAMLTEGGLLAVDEHFQDVQHNILLRAAFLQVAEEEIFPVYRQEGMALELPASHSHNEGIGMGQMLETIERYLHVESVRYRHINLDLLGPLAYLKFGRSREAQRYGAELAGFINQVMLRAWPSDAEYMTLVAQKRATLPEGPVYSPAPRSSENIFAEQLAAYEHELQRLHTVVAEKNAHIRRLEGLLARIGNGRVMRLLNWATGKE